MQGGSVRDDNPWDAATNGYSNDYVTPRDDEDGIDYSRYESSNLANYDDSNDVPLPRPEQKKLNKRSESK